jgi:hypothetical protein
MVSRAEFQSALNAAKPSLLAKMAADDDPAPGPTVEVSKSAGSELSFWRAAIGHIARASGFPDLAPISHAARAAVAASLESLERRLAKTLQSARVLEGESLDMCIAGMHTILDGLGYPRHDRFIAFPWASWRKLALDNPTWLNTFEVWPGAILVAHKDLGEMIWVRSRHLEEVPAVMFHAHALNGGIQPFDATPGQVASAAVRVRVVNPEGLRVLRWPS